ncbi:MAG: hypothetical protein GEV06_03570 [Luteitalea sp.]|nr:hypothetical protein [Luteitalea sp.]
MGSLPRPNVRSDTTYVDAKGVLAEAVAYSTGEHILASADTHVALFPRQCTQLLPESPCLRSRSFESGDAESDGTTDDAHLVKIAVVVDIQGVALPLKGLLY